MCLHRRSLRFIATATLLVATGNKLPMIGEAFIARLGQKPFGDHGGTIVFQILIVKQLLHNDTLVNLTLE